ncbi:MAG: MarC family protein [Bacteroidales bacterium]
MKLFISSLVAFFVLINPVQKILVINSLQKNFSHAELQYIAYKSTFAAALILIFFFFLGQFVFTYIFHVELYSFKIACGMVLVITGLSGLQKGVMVNMDENMKIDDLTAVPIAMPMIAGPATITAAVTFSAHYGRVNTLLAIITGLVINMLLMLSATAIGKFLIKYNFMNPLVRIFGLIVATIGLQMVFDGISEFIATVG